MKLIQVALIIAISSCSSKKFEVTVEGFKVPKKKLSEIQSIGVAIDTQTPKSLRDEIFETLKSCRPFNKVEKLSTKIDISKAKSSELKEVISKSIGKNLEARQLHSILALSTTVKKTKKKLEKSTIFRFSDKKELLWNDSYGIPRSPLFGLSKSYELAPRRKIKRKSTFIRSTDFIYKSKYALFNQITGKLIRSGIISTNSTLSVFSRKSSVNPKDTLNAVLSSFNLRLKDSICANPSFKNHIYPSNKDGTTGALTNEGYELAKENKWDLAASKWKSALIKSPSDSIANHNIGIYYEMIGEPEKAYKHYIVKSKGKTSIELEDKRYDKYLESYITPNLQAPILPQIAFISSGNWVYIRAEKYRLKNKVYPIYRLEMNRSEVDQTVIGIHIREIGSIHIKKKTEKYYVGRIRDMIVDYPILPGDYLMI